MTRGAIVVSPQEGTVQPAYCKHQRVCVASEAEPGFPVIRGHCSDYKIKTRRTGRVTNEGYLKTEGAELEFFLSPRELIIS